MTKTGKAAKALVLLAFAVVLADGAFATLDDIRTWTDASGDHRWNNAMNWDPQQDANTRNVFPAGRDWEVIIEGTDKYYFSFELPEGSGTVTLKGAANALLQPGTGAFIQIPAGRELNVDGPQLQIGTTDIDATGFINGTLRTTSGYMHTGGDNVFKTFGGAAKVIVDGGIFGCTNGNGTLTFTNNATLTVNGGLAKIYRGNYRSPDPPQESITRVFLNGGTYWNSDPQYGGYMTVFGSGARFVNNGGTLLWCGARNYATIRLDSGLNSPQVQGQGDAFAGLLPSTGGTLILPTSSTDYRGALHFAVDGDYDVGGTIYATNNASAATGNVYLDSNNVALRGGATIYANALKVNSNKTCTNDLDIARLNLGIGGLCRYSNAGSPFQYVNFHDGIEFGAWGGDVPRSMAYTIRMFVSLEGPVAFDTQDCFEPAASRNIDMDCLNLNGMTELKAVGGGMVALYPSSTGVDELRSVEVNDGTTLAFCTNVAVKLKTMNLKLGANAKLKINMKNGDYVDASATAELGEGAKIVVTDVPASLAEGKLYPVYFAPAGSVPDLSKIEYAGGSWPTGWGLAKTGNAVYLTDGNVTADSTAREGSRRNWSGAGDDNDYSNINNWVDGLGATSACHAQFYGKRNTAISVRSAQTLRTFEFFGDSGPFMFSGSKISFQYPGQSTLDNTSIASVKNNGAFPVVVADVVDNATEANCLLFQSFKEGSVSMIGGTSGSYPIGFGGDIRLGGERTAHWLRCASSYGNAKVTRTSRLTVMPGAMLTVSDQDGDFNELGAGALAVAKTGSATIGGTRFLLTSNNTHYVDGVLTVTCPLVPQGRQTFRGDGGTLTLSGGVAGAAGGVRVEGNMTFVPANLVNDVAVSLKGNITIAPTADWTYGGDATLDLVHHSRLTIATGGRKMTFEKPIVSESGIMALTGAGVLKLAAGTVFHKVTCAGGATLGIAANSEDAGRYVDVLAVRDDDDSIAFGSEFKVKKRLDEATGRTVYSARRKLGLVLTYR